MRDASASRSKLLVVAKEIIKSAAAIIITTKATISGSAKKRTPIKYETTELNIIKTPIIKNKNWGHCHAESQ